MESVSVGDAERGAGRGRRWLYGMDLILGAHAAGFLLTCVLLIACSTPPEPATRELGAEATELVTEPTSTALPTSTATSLPTVTAPASPTPTSTATATEPSLKHVTVPYWISLSYPEDWVPVTGENEGLLGFSTHQISLNPSELPDSGAMFFVIYDDTESSDPLQAVQAFADSLLAGTEVLSEPERITVGGQAAARMTYSWPGESGRTFITEWTSVVDDNGRMAAALATSDARHWQTFTDTFARMRDSLRFEDMLPAPNIEEASSPVDDAVSYQYVPLKVELSYPSSWSPSVQDAETLSFVPPAALSESGGFNSLIISAPPPTAGTPLNAEAVLEEMEQSSFATAAPASPISATTIGGQQMAFRYYASVWEQKPFLILLGSATRGDSGVVAMSIMDEEEFRDDMETIARSIVINPDIQDGRSYFTADWSPDGERLAFTSRQNGLASIYIMELGDGTMRRLTDDSEDASYADWSPDGNYIVYNVGLESGRHLFVRATSGADRRQLTGEPGTEDSYPDWSPDGDQIVFARYDHIAVEGEDVDAEIFLLDLEKGNTARPLNVRGTSPAFSPDGTRIAFVSDLNGSQDIYVMDVDGNNIVQITDDPYYDLWPAWSPDGDRIVFVSVSEREGNWDLYSVRVDGGNRERLTDHPAPDYAPAWSPDGTRIAFDSNREGVLSIYIMDADGANVTQVTE